MKRIAAALLASLSLSGLPAKAQLINQKQIIGSPFPTTASGNTALTALPSTYATSVQRLGFSTAGDGGQMLYMSSNSACSLNAGAGDGGSQVPSADGKCWIWSEPASGVDARVFGCNPTGTPDSGATATCIQTAINAVAGTNVPLLVNSGLYYIHSALSSTGVVAIDGGLTSRTSYDTPTCTSGFITDQDINLLTLTGSTDTVEGVCFQMGSAAGQRLSGAALTVGGTVGNNMSSSRVRFNRVLWPYNGIVIGGATNGLTQTVATLVAFNTVVSPINWGIANGPLSSHTSTHSEYDSNTILCRAANTNAIGYAFFDGPLNVNAGEVGPYNCNIGTAITPGDGASGNGSTGQNVAGTFTGVSGDTSITFDTLIDPQTADGEAHILQFTGSWFGSANHAGATALMIRDTGAGGSGHCQQIAFENMIAHGTQSGSQPVVYVGGDCSEISFVGGRVMASGGNTAQTGIQIADSASDVTVDSMQIGTNLFGGSLTNGISITSSGDLFSIIGNIFNQIAIGNTILWSGSSPSSRATITDNTPIDNGNFPTLAISGSAITAPIQSNFKISGGGTLNQMNGPLIWENRKVFIQPISSTNLATGGASGAFCAGQTVVHPFWATWDNVGGCWLVSGG